MVKSSETAGITPMRLGGRLVTERERLLGMTDEERRYRAQYLQDQQLSQNEPRHVPELYKEQFNIFRRIYRAPLDIVQKLIQPVLGYERALKIRYFTGKGLMFVWFAYGTTYYMKHNKNDWTKRGGWYVCDSRIAVHRGDPEYPKVSDRTKGADYADRGFKANTIKL